MKTYPLGRILLDVPSDFTINYAQTKFYDTEFQYLPATKVSTIAAEVAKLIDEAKNTLHLKYTGKSLFINEFDLPHQGKAVLAWPHPYAVSLAKMTCWFVNEDARVYSWTTDASPKYFTNIEGIIHRIAKNLRSFDMKDPCPQVSGFCFVGGLFQEHIGVLQEFQKILFTSPRGFSIECRTCSGYDTTDFFEMYGPDYISEAQREGSQVFRYAERNIHTLVAQEICLAEPSEFIFKNLEYDFQINIPERSEEPHCPDIYINMYMDDKNVPKPFPTEHEALALWDTITSTLRIRPNAL